MLTPLYLYLRTSPLLTDERFISCMTACLREQFKSNHVQLPDKAILFKQGMLGEPYSTLTLTVVTLSTSNESTFWCTWNKKHLTRRGEVTHCGLRNTSFCSLLIIMNCFPVTTFTLSMLWVIFFRNRFAIITMYYQYRVVSEQKICFIILLQQYVFLCSYHNHVSKPLKVNAYFRLIFVSWLQVRPRHWATLHRKCLSNTVVCINCPPY